MVIGKIQEAIDRLELDLSGKTVLTEAATGAYTVTPVIAAMAGARVFAFTKNTRYGSVDEVRSQTLSLLNQSGKNNPELEVIDRLPEDVIACADVITNSGHLRPLDESKLRHISTHAVIPLMYEAWEWRDADLDLEFCKKHNIKVGATNERHPGVDVFNYLGDMAIKLILDAGFTFQNNKFVLVSNNDFGPFIAKKLSTITSLAVCDLASRRKNYEGLTLDGPEIFPMCRFLPNLKTPKRLCSLPIRL